MTLLANTDPPDFDPHTPGADEKANVVRNIYDTLTVLSADLQETLPSLATEWVAIDDNTWEFQLREGVEFSNGEPFNADAVKFSVDRILDPNAEVARVSYSFPTMESAEVIDDTTVRIHTKVPDPIFPERAYSLDIVPPEYTGSVPESEFAMNPIGTGAYTLAEFAPGQRIVLEVNPNYWGDAPEVDRFIIRPVPEASTRTAELQTGGADIIKNAPVGQIPELEASEGVNVIALAGRRIAYIGMNQLPGGEEALLDKRVRQALNYAVDVSLILDTVMEGYGDRTATVFRPDFTGFDPELEPYPHDPDRAKELLAEAGHPDGLSLSIQLSEEIFASGSEVVNALVAQLAKVGVDVSVEILDHPSYRSVVIDGQEANKVAPLYAWQWGALEPSADSLINGTLETGGISSYYSNSRLDELTQAARQEMDVAKREDLYKQIQTLLKEEAPFIFLYQIPDVYGVSDRVKYTPRLDQYVIAKDLKRGN
ncbi:ABC transporter substrate-binding protein [Microbacterium alcoholitolerans]|uniref:ABC transporter substrate-binding protein n=1 Tax=unclassified Microbacterium TaxID=2609290 RepID=UPI003D1675D4